MNRRGFLRAMIGGVAAAAAVRTFPFRVFSFPKEITRAPAGSFDGLDRGEYQSFSVVTFSVVTNYELLQDSAFDIELYLRQAIAVRLLRNLNNAYGRPLLEFSNFPREFKQSALPLPGARA